MAETAPAWLIQRERGSVLGLQVLSWLSRHAPDLLVNALLRAVALWFAIFPGAIARRGCHAYLAAVLGRAPRFVDRFRQILTFAHVVLDRPRLLSSGTAGFEIRARGEEIVRSLHLSGRGGVLLGAHFGSFEALRAFDRLLPGLTVRYLMFQDNADKTTRLLGRLNREIAARVIPAGDGQSAMLAVREALDTGQFVAWLGDRSPTRLDRAMLRVEFMGRPIDLPRAPYLGAIFAGVPLILCFAPRTGPRRYDIVFTEIYDGAPVARLDRDAVCRMLARRYAAELAAICHDHPYNWFNFYDVWG